MPAFLVDPDLDGVLQIAAGIRLPNPVEHKSRFEAVRREVKDLTSDLVPLLLAHAENGLVDRCRKVARSHFFGIAVYEEVLGE